MFDTGINTTEPSFEKYRNKILEEIKQMQQDETMFFKVEFATPDCIWFPFTVSII